MSMLSARSLDAGHMKGNPVVRGIDLDVAAGEIVALLGPNGAGKTTLLETMAGLLPRLGGELSVDGTAVASADPRSAVRSGLVLVPDDRALFRKLSTEQNLKLAVRADAGRPLFGGRRRRSEAAARVAEIVDWFPSLGRRARVPAGQLSGGEQQMLAIGRALLQRPKVLLIDELRMGLAPVIVESILPVLRRVADADGTAIVLVEQHVRLALEVADRAVVLVHGDIALESGASELAADPARLERAYLGGSVADGSDLARN
ncbi:ABC transporter ATP-binding protein [Gordonia sp. VNK21]|uniref:ABC transporter ATP-binding protein n=1 Tax=Gordonia sp. VNK21 TaxID=3382483 RepID=UPI0038D35602